VKIVRQLAKRHQRLPRIHSHRCQIRLLSRARQFLDCESVGDDRIAQWRIVPCQFPNGKERSPKVRLEQSPFQWLTLTRNLRQQVQVRVGGLPGRPRSLNKSLMRILPHYLLQVRHADTLPTIQTQRYRIAYAKSYVVRESNRYGTGLSSKSTLSFRSAPMARTGGMLIWDLTAYNHHCASRLILRHGRSG
jgi:hypothetical protein